MTPVPSIEQRIVGFTLSNFLADRRERILTEWLEKVLADRGVPAADGLTLTQLKDHIPQLLDDLNRTLDDALNPEVKAKVAGRAATHGYLRWQQNYDISQLIREISDLRTVMIHHLAEFHDERVTTNNGERGVFAMVVLHSFFDKMIRISVEEFINASKANEGKA